jgi:hypothetical protein
MVIHGTSIIRIYMTPKAKEPQSMFKEVENPLILPREMETPLR